ncbi:MAG: hypothetical protein Q9227_004831 [Pyrenula ochraceoflavens]
MILLNFGIYAANNQSLGSGDQYSNSSSNKATETMRSALEERLEQMLLQDEKIHEHITESMNDMLQANSATTEALGRLDARSGPLQLGLNIKFQLEITPVESPPSRNNNPTDCRNLRTFCKSPVRTHPGVSPQAIGGSSGPEPEADHLPSSSSEAPSDGIEILLAESKKKLNNLDADLKSVVLNDYPILSEQWEKTLFQLLNYHNILCNLASNLESEDPHGFATLNFVKLDHYTRLSHGIQVVQRLNTFLDRLLAMASCTGRQIEAIRIELGRPPDTPFDSFEKKSLQRSLMKKVVDQVQRNEDINETLFAWTWSTRPDVCIERK